MRRRPFRIVLLALGTILGYGFAIHSMRRHHHHWGYERPCGSDHRWGSEGSPRSGEAEPSPKSEAPAPAN
ncbi:MAG TPA: hypothetical protein VJT73_21655 [Polyangiaceae bacterium]|nr:hypothetical protein [Polyangiaceae bacterium]